MKNNVLHLSRKFNNPPNAGVLPAIPTWLLDDLYEIQNAWKVPLEILVQEMAESFICDNWDLKKGRPRKTRWQREDEKKKPGSYSGRVVKTK